MGKSVKRSLVLIVMPGTAPAARLAVIRVIVLIIVAIGASPPAAGPHPAIGGEGGFDGRIAHDGKAPNAGN